jgi:hypothetical protein
MGRRILRRRLMLEGRGCLVGMPWTRPRAGLNTLSTVVPHPGYEISETKKAHLSVSLSC